MNNSNNTDELNTRIDLNSKRHFMFLDKFDDNQVWLSLNVPDASIKVVINFDKAKLIIEALQKIMEHENV